MAEGDVLIADIIALEWLIALLAIVLLIVVGALLDWARRRATAAPVGNARPADTPTWHALSAEEALERVGSGREGLTPEEARQRIQTHGPNWLPEAKPCSPLLRFLAQWS